MMLRNDPSVIVVRPTIPDLFFAWPVPEGSRVSLTFAAPSPTGLRSHRGTDFAVVGVPVRNMFPGVVEFVRRSGSFVGDWWSYGGYGHFVDVRHQLPGGGMFKTRYCHLATVEAAIQPGVAIEAGRALGPAGATGYTFGAHLHEELRLFGGEYGEDGGPGATWSGSPADSLVYIGRQPEMPDWALSEAETQVVRNELLPYAFSLKIVGAAADRANLTSKDHSGNPAEPESKAIRRLGELMKDAQREVDEAPAGPRRDLVRALTVETGPGPRMNTGGT